MGFQTCEEGLGRKLIWVAEWKSFLVYGSGAVTVISAVARPWVTSSTPLCLSPGGAAICSA